MDQSNKLYRKCQRPRPYDLRRKVLLKNFLKEQMSFMPPVNDVELENEPTVANGENTIQSSSIPEKCQNSNDENDQKVATDLNDGLVQNFSEIPAIITYDATNEKLPLVDHDKSVSTKPVLVTKLSSFMNLRSNRKITNNVLKAKHSVVGFKATKKTVTFSESIKNIFKSGKKNGSNVIRVKKKSSSSDRDSKKNSDKSFAWRLFRPIKESRKSFMRKRTSQRNVSIKNNQKDVSYQNSKPNEACSTASQSVQTDDNWGLEEKNHLEQSNMMLREENRLLVDSLSYFMTDVEISPRKSYQDSFFDNYQPLSSSSTKNIGRPNFKSDWFPFSENSEYPPNAKRAKYESQEKERNSYSRSSKVLRSKSVQEHDKHSRINKRCQRTSSMHVSRSKSNVSNYSNPNVSFSENRTSFYSQHLTKSRHLRDETQILIPRAKSPNVPRNMSVGDSVRHVQRRSSMPERPHSKKHPRACRRAGSFHDCYSSGHIPFHAMPAEAFY